MFNRKHFGALLVSSAVALIAVGTAFVTTRTTGQAPTATTPTLSVQASSVSVDEKSDATLDSDGDGVPNWREVLAKTDPNNPDTDGDGMGDGDELAAGADPAVFGTEPKDPYAYHAPESLAQSDALGRELFVTYLSLKEKGDFNPATLSTAVDAIVERHLSDTSSEEAQYTSHDIVVAKSDTVASRSAYRADVDGAIQKASAVPEYELSTFYALLKTSDAEHAQTLSNDAKIYRAIVKELLAVPVPASYATTHVNLVNALAYTASAVERLVGKYGDPYEMLLSVNMFSESEKQFTAAYSEFNARTDTTTP